MQGAIYISNKSQYLKNKERYEKTIDGVPLSFQEFFQIIDKLNFHFMYTLRNLGIELPDGRCRQSRLRSVTV